MTSNNGGYHPECRCQTGPLTREDLLTMHAEGRHAEINQAFEAGRFQLDNQNQEK